jgi:hypothetical protein
MKVMPIRIFAFACVLLCAAGVRAQVPNPFVLPAGPNTTSGVVSADFNGDSRADLVHGGQVLFGNADGTFTPGATISLGTTALDCPKPSCVILFVVVAMADFTGDGKPDLLVQQLVNSTPTPTGVYVIPGNGDGTFGAPKGSNVGVYLTNVQVVDVNGDGKLDLVGSAFGQDGQVFVSLGNGDGTFGVSTPYTVFAGAPLAVVTGDFNGDGKVDIAAAGYVANAVGSVGVLFGNGDGTFAPSVTTSVGVNSPGGMVAADFNGDGKIDLVLSGQRLSDHTGQTYLLAGKGDGTFQAPSIIAPGAGVNVVADLNGDGKPDIVIWSPPIVEVLLGNGNGTFQQKAAFPTATNQVTSPVAIGDFNGDGKLDIADAFSATFGNGDGTFQDVDASIVNAPAGLAQLTTVVSGDFNGDGKSDLAVGVSGLNPSVYILLGDGTGKYAVSNVYQVSSAPSALRTGDFNGDGKTDLAFGTQNSDSTASVQVMLGHGNGSFGAAIGSLLGPGSVGSPGPTIEVADFNGDGLSDVATIENGELAVVISAGDGTLESPVSYFAGATPASVGVGDFNGDGKADAVVCSAAGLGVLLGKGDGTLSAVIFPQAPTPPGVGGGTATCGAPTVADFNNDGLSDVLELGEVLLSNGDGTFTPAAASTPDFSATVVADVNGDGKLDLVKSDGLTVFPGNGDGTFSNFASQAVNFLPAWINPLIWADSNDQNNQVTTNAVFSVVDFGGGGLPGIAMIVQNAPGGEISLPNPLPAPAPDFMITVGMPTVVAPGGQTELIVTVKKIAGFSEAVALSCGELPVGVTCTYPSAVINGGAGKTTVTIAAASSAPTGTYALTFTGTATGTASGLSHGVQRAITIASAAGATNADLRPLTVNFQAQPIGGAAATQTATLSNAGTAQLQVSSVSITGTNARDFSISSNGCATAVAAFSNCQIVVAFSPTDGGVRSAMLVVNDNATGGVQVVSLTGTANDFTVGAGSGGSSSTVAAGKTATYSISVGGAGFTGTVALSCSGAPTASNCAVSPASVTLTGSTAATATVTVTTTARSEILPMATNRDHRWTPGIYGATRTIVASATVVISFGLLVICGLRLRRRLSWIAVAGSVVLVFAGIGIAGCGGGGMGSNPTGGSTTGTPAGSYNITVTATAGSGANAVTHTTQLTLVVQ